MTESEKKLIKQFALKKISYEDFRREFDKDTSDINTYVLTNLKNSIVLRDSELVSYSLMLGFNITFPYDDPRFFKIICSLLLEQWHYNHEDIVTILQTMKLPGCEEQLFMVANTYFEYLSYNDCESLIIKCSYALGDIRSEEAISKLKLMSKSNNQIINEAGKKQLKRIGIDN